MDPELTHKIAVCRSADGAEWEDAVAAVRGLSRAQTVFLHEHPPGLVAALWAHFAATRDRCGCASAAHERPDCAAALIERLLLDGDEAG